MLEKTGNLGRVVELTDANGNKVPSFVSIDRDTKELVSVHVNSIYVPPKIGNTEFTPKDIGILKSGKQLLKDYTDKNGNTYPVVLQCSAANQNIEFVPRANRLFQTEKKEQTEEKAALQEHKPEKPSQEQTETSIIGFFPMGKSSPSASGKTITSQKNRNPTMPPVSL